MKLRTRLAGSLLHDQLWSWREKFGGQAADTPPDINPTLSHIISLGPGASANGCYVHVDSQNDHSLANPSLVPETSAPTVSNSVIDQFPFEEIFDMGLLSLLPFDLESDVPDSNHPDTLSNPASR